MKYAFALALSLVAIEAHASRFLPAISVAIAEAELAQPAPTPDVPSDKCENCNGTGKVGDGTVFVDCPVCSGDGIKSDYQIAVVPHTNYHQAKAGGAAESPATEAPPADPNFAHANLRWDGANRRYLSADGRYAAAPGGKFQPRRWQTIPAQGHYVSRRVCSGGVCRQVRQWVQTAPARRVEVFGTSTSAVDPSLSADQQPTPMDGVRAGLRALIPQPGEVLVDYGAGHDARWLITAVREFGTQRAVGVEIDPEAAESARRHVAEAGLSDRIQIVTGDAATADVRADIGVAYLWEETLAKLRPQIEKLDRFVSYGFAAPGLNMQSRPAGNGTVYAWQKPQAMVPVTRTVSKIVGLPRGSYCQVCGRHCGNPMAHMRQQLIVGYRPAG